MADHITGASTTCGLRLKANNARLGWAGILSHCNLLLSGLVCFGWGLGAILRQYAYICVTSLLAGCASAQLNYNTLDVGGTVEWVYTQQILLNVTRTINDNRAIPSQVELTTGTIQTTGGVQPTVSAPLSHQITTAAGAATQFVRAGSSLGVQTSDSWQQQWNISPVTDYGQLTQLIKLYRAAVLGPPVGSKSCPNYVPDRCRWAYWSGSGEHPANSTLKSLGSFAGREIFIKQSDYDAGVFQQFVLAIFQSSRFKPAPKADIKAIQEVMPPAPLIAPR